jgi:Uncharacterized protein, possibly involved in motility
MRFIELTRFDGVPFLLNAGKIETITANVGADTLIGLHGMHTLEVRETPDEIMNRISETGDI